MTDLLAMTAELVDFPSVSFAEGAFADWVEAELRAVPHLSVDRVGDNVVARTTLGRGTRIVLGGHLDTVPVNDNATARIEGDTLHGLGSADMKGGLAVMLHLARTVAEPVHDVTYVFYAREEVAVEHNGLRELFHERPDLLEADLAVLGEPTSAAIEAGCQGTLRVVITFTGARAHTARGWMGRNAVHRLGDVLRTIAAYEPRQPVVDGCRYHEGLQAVFVEGGVAGNVVPDVATLKLNHRFAPDRSADDAVAHVRAIVEPYLEPGDSFEIEDLSPGARPGLDHPVFAGLVARNNIEVRAKLGWTDVAFFSERGIPAINLGPGDATLAHTRAERLDRASLEACWAALLDLLTVGPE
ncbi:MAG: succinyl-diaminopimelate desuccinylase [Acidimicrobiales bacterium]|nr:succinyl-diaminopimelate desuccinylase [Acidimicrobiales bacterium]